VRNRAGINFKLFVNQFPELCSRLVNVWPLSKQWQGVNIWQWFIEPYYCSELYCKCGVTLTKV